MPGGGHPRGNRRASSALLTQRRVARATLPARTLTAQIRLANSEQLGQATGRADECAHPYLVRLAAGRGWRIGQHEQGYEQGRLRERRP